MPKNTALAFMLFFFTFLTIVSTSSVNIYAQTKIKQRATIDIPAQLEKGSSNTTFYNVYWLSIVSIFSIPIFLRIYKYKDKNDSDDESYTSEFLGMKGGKSSIDDEEEDC